MAKVNCQSTLARPRCRALRNPATVSAQPHVSSIRFLIRWLIVQAGWRVVRPSMAERRPLAGLSRSRRLAHNYERLAAMSVAMIQTAMSRAMLRRVPRLYISTFETVR